MLAIGLPMFWRLHLPWRKQLPLLLIFAGGGVFVLVCAILNKLYSFTEPFGAAWTFWYVRESSTALLVANLPFLSTLLKRVFGSKSGSDEFVGRPAISARYVLDGHSSGSPQADQDYTIEVSSESDPQVHMDGKAHRSYGNVMHSGTLSDKGVRRGSGGSHDSPDVLLQASRRAISLPVADLSKPR
jgi:hypothetical protein